MLWKSVIRCWLFVKGNVKKKISSKQLVVISEDIDLDENIVVTQKKNLK